MVACAAYVMITGASSLLIVQHEAIPSVAETASRDLEYKKVQG
jgi:hypothetical protein